MKLSDLLDACRTPAPYEPGDPFWEDPFVARSMLEAHLSPDTDAASFRPEKIRAVCDFLPGALKLPEGGSLLDLGCGPGLYDRILAEKGFFVTGIDLSENSIGYAKAHSVSPKTRFVCGSYLSELSETLGRARFDAAMLIYEDFGPLSPDDRRRLLENLHGVLKEGGRFALDVSGMEAYARRQSAPRNSWSLCEAGFWRPHRHLLLEKTFFYPQISALCDLYAVADEKVAVYRVYQTFYTVERLKRELAEGGFAVEAVYANLWGEKLTDTSPVIGAVAVRT